MHKRCLLRCSIGISCMFATTMRRNDELLHLMLKSSACESTEAEVIKASEHENESPHRRCWQHGTDDVRRPEHEPSRIALKQRRGIPRVGHHIRPADSSQVSAVCSFEYLDLIRITPRHYSTALRTCQSSNRSKSNQRD